MANKYEISAWSYDGLSCYEKILLLRVASFHPRPLSMSQPSIAKMLGMGRSKLQMAAYDLESHYCIKCTSYGRGNTYALHPSFIRIADEEHEIRQADKGE